MRSRHAIHCAGALLVALLAVGGGRASANSLVPGLRGTSFTLSARQDRISTPDGGSYLLWGYAAAGRRAQYPGPTLIVNQGDMVTVRLTNSLPTTTGQRASIVFHGIEGVTATCARATDCDDGPITKEARAYRTVTYTFRADRPGTFLYSSGSNADLQTEMGLLGALIVRPPGFDDTNPATWTAYGSADSAFDREYLFLLSEMDPRIHDLIDSRGVAALANTDYLSDYFPNYWFINGRNAPDTMADAFIGALPTQPYNALPRMHPGERVLMRVVGAGHDLHPFHHHGNHARIIARDAWPLRSTPGGPIDLSFEGFTIQSIPGQTVDAVFEWTGKGLGWDIYGTGPEHAHDCNRGPDGFDPVTREWCDDHGVALPVVLPELQDVEIGALYSGSPYLGVMGNLPPGFGMMNPTAGYTFMWHSHTEREITSYDVFPGGMMTMLIIEPPGTDI
jgi:FtsP/CotA-like multicopper oxidase with cupredoxin domain